MTQRTAAARSGEAGHALLIVVVMVIVMVIGSTVAMKVWGTVMKREKEEELIFRGRQYAMALYLYRKQVGTLPIDLKVLNEKVGQKQVFVLRRPYKDPMTGGDFGVIFAGPNNTPIPDEPVGGGDTGLDDDLDQDKGMGDGPAGSFGNPGNPAGTVGSPSMPSAFGTPSGTATGLPIMGVHSKSAEKAQGPAKWRDLEHYNEWYFLITDITPNQQPGQNPGQVVPGQQLPGGQPPPGSLAPGATGPRGAVGGSNRITP